MSTIHFGYQCLRQPGNLLVGVNIYNRSIKKDFTFIVFLSSFVPFLVSLLFLWLLLRNSYEKIEQVNSQIQHTQELEILDAMHKSMGQVYQAVQSVEMNEYFSANSDLEGLYRETLKNYLLSLSHFIRYKNVNWIILGSRGNILFSTDKNEKINHYDINRMNGASYHEKLNEVLLSLPIFYNSTNATERHKNIVAYVALKIPFSSVQKEYPYLKNIKNIPQDLSALKFEADFNIPVKNNMLNYILYFYILIFIIFNLIAVYFGIKLLQDKIVNKLKLLALRVLNDINSSSKIIFENSLQNEIDSLSSIFNKYLKYVSFLQYEIEKSSQLAAVGHIAHTIAHDLRKPFSNTTLFVEQVEKMKSLEEISSFVQEYKPILKNSIFYVEHLLKEIMEAGISQLNVSEVKLEEILLKTFANLMNFPEFCSVEIEYSLKLKYYLKVDELRIVRIFSNLILNAMEAMNFKGKIWIVASSFPSQEFTEIIIGNNNSSIDSLDIPHLFEPFYTKNKKNGTGLGLSIAQKIIQLHGGSIRCQSSGSDSNLAENQHVEFILTLPLSAQSYLVDISQLPKIIPSFHSATTLLSKAKLDSVVDSQFKQPQNRPQDNKDKIVLLDDDPFVGRSWKRMTTDAEVISFLYPEDLLIELKENPNILNENTLLISDFNFGVNSKLNFYECISELRKSFVGAIFLSTDAVDEDLDFNFLAQNKIIKIDKTPYLFAELRSKYKNKIERR